MRYTVYQTQHIKSGKIYIGKHQTKDINDDYLGSGNLLKRAIKKYGPQAFAKTILFDFDTEAEMNAKEAELVTEDFCARKDTYNICEGGKGGFDYVNRSGKNGPGSTLPAIRKNHEWWERSSPEERHQRIEPLLKGAQKHRETHGSTFLGKRHTQKFKDHMANLMRTKYVGSGNPNYGKMWVTDGKNNKVIHKNSLIPEGWVKGRTIAVLV